MVGIISGIFRYGHFRYTEFQYGTVEICGFRKHKVKICEGWQALILHFLREYVDPFTPQRVYLSIYSPGTILIHLLPRDYIVSVLGQEEGYTVKYGLSPRAIPRAQALFYRIS